MLKLAFILALALLPGLARDPLEREAGLYAKPAATRHPTKSGAKHSAKPVAAHPSGQGQPTPERYRQIQQALADKGYFKGDVNGQWGPASADAMKRFQAEQNLTSDGKLNSLSLIALGLGPKPLKAQPVTTQPVPATSQPGVRQ